METKIHELDSEAEEIIDTELIEPTDSAENGESDEDEEPVPLSLRPSQVEAVRKSLIRIR